MPAHNDSDFLMNLHTLLTPEHSYTGVNADNKAAVLQYIAARAASTVPDADEQAICAALEARERLGSTGVGEGVAIPHCRLNQCNQPVGLLLKLDQAVEFDSIDGHPVDLIFALLTPSEDADGHLAILSQLAALFNNADFRQALRQAEDAQALYQHAVDFQSAEQTVS